MTYSIIGFSLNETIVELLKKMSTTGINMESTIIIRQNADKFKSTFQNLRTESDIIFVVGGLNITNKDFVKKAISEIYDKALIKNETAIQNLDSFCKHNPLKCIDEKTKNKLAQYPEGFQCIPQENGIFSSAIFTSDKKTVVLLSEISNEAMNAMDSCILGYILKKKNICGSTQIFRLYGAAYGEITNALNKLKKSKLYTYQIEYSYTSDAIVTFVFSKNTENSFIEEIKSEFYTELFEYVYADEDISLADKIVALLTVRKKKLGIAESFTGGMVASSIVAVSGASEIFDEGYVTYSNNAKVKELNVSEKTLKEHGAVSDETAYEMAVGLLHKGNDYVIATTGIAGPGGGSSNKPVGLCYVAVGSNDGIHVHRKIYSGSRNEVREQATLDALYKLIKIIR